MVTCALRRARGLFDYRNRCFRQTGVWNFYRRIIAKPVRNRAVISAGRRNGIIPLPAVRHSGAGFLEKSTDTGPPFDAREQTTISQSVLMDVHQ